MPTYKSFTAAIKDLMLPKDRVGQAVVKSIKEMINTNSAPGVQLSENWVRRKTQNHNTKLLETGELRDSTIYSVDKNSVSIGYNNATSSHKPHSGNQTMTNAGMAEVHNEGNSKGLYNIPARPFLFANGSWAEKHKLAVQKFISDYYKNKGII
jgi:phage gpG-like protein